MDELLSEVFSRLATQGIHADKSSLRMHHSQGFMSSVYTLSSDRGNLILHVVSPISEHVRNETWRKLVFLGKFLTIHQQIPSAEVLLGERIGEKYFIVQQMLDGEPAGTRDLNGLNVIDRWNSPEANQYIQQIQEILASLHTIPVQGAGWPMMQGDTLTGRYASWREFLQGEIPLWLESLERTDEIVDLQLPLNVSHNQIKRFTDHALKVMEDAETVLVHGDAINPSNVLIKDSKITGLLDWEWSIFADPAWEFCDPGWDAVIRHQGIDTYLTRSGRSSTNERDAFMEKIKLYRPLWNLWGAHIHSGVETNQRELKLYRVLRGLLNKSLQEVGFD